MRTNTNCTRSWLLAILLGAFLTNLKVKTMETTTETQNPRLLALAKYLDCDPSELALSTYDGEEN